MSDTKAAWDEVGSAFSGLGVKLKAHFDQARAESQAPSEPAESPTPTAPPEPSPGAAEAASGDADDAPGADAAKKERDVREAFHRLGEALEGAFEALGAAARDPAMKEDVKHVGQSLGTALSTTFADVSEEVRKALKRSGKDPDGASGEGTATDGQGGA